MHPDQFDAYLTYDDDGTGDFPGCFSWLANDLPGFITSDHTACNFYLGEGDRRPAFYDQDGPLKDAQENGVTFDHLLDIYAEAGRNIRPHLLQS